MIPMQVGTMDNTEVNSDSITMTGKTFLYDFETGDFILDDKGNLISVSNLEALKVWIEKVLKTTKNKYDVYEGTNYGTPNLQDLLVSGNPYEYITCEVEATIKAVLLKNTAIKSVQNFKFTRDGSLLSVSFDCSTIYGAVGSEVTFS